MAEISASPPKISVVGSINLDLVVACASLPAPGQTVAADSLRQIPGGKGANQAVAAARAGGRVAMVGRVGDDDFGPVLRDNLDRESIAVESVATTTSTSSGLAIVAVQSDGENSILLVSGANGCFTARDVREHAREIQTSAALLVQLEIPIESVTEAMRIAREAGTRIIFDPAPMPPSLDDDLLNVDVLCPNQSETASLVGFEVHDHTSATRAIEGLRGRGVEAVIITMGAGGAIYGDAEGVHAVPAIPVKAVDTTAAGDAFAGALAVRLGEGASLNDAVRFAVAAGSLAAGRHGAQPGLPTRGEIEAALP